MSNRTVIIILFIAVGLLGFIVFFERDSTTTAERESRRRENRQRLPDRPRRSKPRWWYAAIPAYNRWHTTHIFG